MPKRERANPFRTYAQYPWLGQETGHNNGLWDKFLVAIYGASGRSEKQVTWADFDWIPATEFGMLGA